MKKSVFLSVIIMFATVGIVYGENPSWKKEPKDFRGIPFGASESQAKEHIPNLYCMDVGVLGRICDDKAVFKIGNVIMNNTLIFKEDRLDFVSLGFKSKDYDFIKIVFVEKYGSPTKTVNKIVRTKVGVEYNNQTLIWFGKNVSISLYRFHENIEESAIGYTVNSSLEQWIGDKEKIKKEAVKDF